MASGAGEVAGRLCLGFALEPGDGAALVDRFWQLPRDALEVAARFRRLPETIPPVREPGEQLTTFMCGAVVQRVGLLTGGEHLFEVVDRELRERSSHRR